MHVALRFVARMLGELSPPPDTPLTLEFAPFGFRNFPSACARSALAGINAAACVYFFVCVLLTRDASPAPGAG